MNSGWGVKAPNMSVLSRDATYLFRRPSTSVKSFDGLIMKSFREYYFNLQSKRNFGHWGEALRKHICCAACSSISGKRFVNICEARCLGHNDEVVYYGECSGTVNAVVDTVHNDKLLFFP